MKILITGATGFVGKHLVRHYVGQGHEVIALGRRAQPPIEWNRPVRYIQADITQKIPAITCDICIHAAAKASEDGDWNSFTKTNFTGTANVFNSTKDCRQFIYISSSSVYGQQSAPHIEEETVQLEELNFYGKTKRMAEDFLQTQIAYTKGKSITILRPRAIYGPNDSVLLPRLLRLCKGPFLLMPNGLKVQTSLTSIFNLIDAIDQVILKRPKGVQTFNVSDQQEYEMGKVVKMICEKALKRSLIPVYLPLHFVEAWLRFKSKYLGFSGLSANALQFVRNDHILDNTKMEKELGLRFSHNFYSDLYQL
ncbi:MAG: NAD(P)-dependent oxidoreductase [Saprospiraceae bacterium]|nr:NAD(P)-dependent oxidoreductase [Saprospiraceae bacterium]